MPVEQAVLEDQEGRGMARQVFGGGARLVAALGLLVAVAAGCGGEGRPGGVSPSGGRLGLPARGVALTGAGATFPYPLYSRWFEEYSRLVPGADINYQSIGSGGGIKQITEGTVDFGASDAPLSDEQLAKAPDLVHIPTVAGAEAIVYNLPEVKERLKFTPAVIAGIYLGKIKSWDDPALREANPGVALPARPITVVHRSDGSGTTYIFTHYLSKASPEWKEKVGFGTSVNWPVGLGGKGNEGVAGVVRQTPGSIGYVELAYAVQNRMTYGLVRNRAGKFVEPTLRGTTAAMASVAGSMPEDLRATFTDAPGEDAYPIAGFTYILLHREQRDKEKAETLVNFLWWAVHDGQAYAEELLYAPLAPEVVKRVEEKLLAITYRGTPVLERKG